MLQNSSNIVSGLNPEAQSFMYRGPQVFMAPVKNICFMFQFNQCKQIGDCHRGPDGELQLHICQPCYQIRGEIVEHRCSSNHPGSCDSSHKPYGAIACPFSLTPSSSPQQVSSCQQSPVPLHVPHQQKQQQQSQQGLQICQRCQSRNCKCVYYKHKPTIKCDCIDCHNFLIDLQVEFDDCPSLDNCQFFDKYRSIHERPYLYDNGLCDECNDSLTASHSP